MTEHKRLFVGVRVSVQTANALAAAAETLARRMRDAGVDVKWVAPVNYHVTLKFLGMVRGEVVEAIAGRLRRELPSLRPFELEARGLGTFPPGAETGGASGAIGDRPRVLWVGVGGAGDKALRALQESTEGWMEDLGFAREKRAFHPHLTLGRVLSEGPLRKLVDERRDRVYGGGRVAEVVV